MQVFLPSQEHYTNEWLIKQIVNSEAHSVSYTLSRGNAVVVEYSKDPTTDMFQVWSYETSDGCDV